MSFQSGTEHEKHPERHLERGNVRAKTRTRRRMKTRDRPRLLKCREQIGLRRAELSESHIAPLAKFVEALRKEDYGEVPDFDPWDGGVDAKALFLFEKPGPKAFASGFISRNNDDPTAENTFNFMREAGIPRKLTCLWNVVPGWNGMRRLAPDELARGHEALAKLLIELKKKKLRVVVLVGKRASCAWSKLPDPPDLPTIHSAHPSPIVRGTNPKLWRSIPRQWAKVKDYIQI
jgi:hypothetical protein